MWDKFANVVSKHENTPFYAFKLPLIVVFSRIFGSQADSLSSEKSAVLLRGMLTLYKRY